MTEQKAKKDPKELTVQVRPKVEDTGSLGMTFMFGSKAEDEFSMPEWWSESRDIELYRFSRLPGNDILQGAISSMIKKFKAMNWVLEGPERLVRPYQQILAQAEFGKGWGNALGKSLERYWTTDKGGFWELMGEGDITGPITGPIQGVAYLDGRYCQLTGDPEYPVIFNNAKTKKAHALHTTRVIHFVDQPSPIVEMNDIGFCAVSRVVSASSVLLRLSKYKNEKLSDLPEAGMMIMSNINRQQFDDIRAEYELDRQRMGQQYWRGIMTLFGLDPSQPADAKFIDFSKLPDAFDESRWIEIYINIVSLAFGVDSREFWPVSTGQFGNVMETNIQHLKAKGKAIGELISYIEREINWKILPKAVNFRFDFKDDEEDLSRAQINRAKIESIMHMWRVPEKYATEMGIRPPVTRDEIRQMLADNVQYFNEDFLDVDLVEEIQLTDLEKQKYFGDRIQMDSRGRVKKVKKDIKSLEKAEGLLRVIEENYKNGEVELDDVLNFRLGEILEKRLNL